MSERIPPSRSYAAGRRGRHKHRTSPETTVWEREHLLPAKPPWMSDETYRKLAELRAKL